MRYRVCCAYLLLIGALAFALGAGCSGGGGVEGTVVLVSGKVTNAGTPLEVKSGGNVQVIFDPISEKPGEPPLNKRCLRNVDVQGNYKMTGDMGKGIIPGKYRIAIYQWVPADVKKGEKPGPDVRGKMRDELKMKFSEQASPIVRDVTTKTTTFDFDISKPEG